MFDKQPRFTTIPGLVCKKVPLGFALLFSFMLSACGSDNEMTSLPPMSMSYEKQHPVYVIEGIEYIEIAVLPEMRQIDLIQRGQILAFLDGYSDRMQSDLIVRVPMQSDSRAKHDQAAARMPEVIPPEMVSIKSVLADIKALIAAHDIPSDRVKYSIYEQRRDDTTPALIVLTYESVKAAAKQCSGISGDIFNYEEFMEIGRTFSVNKGCTSQHNLVAMIDNPMDFKYPSRMTPINAPLSYAKHQSYESGQDPSSQAHLEGGTVSEVAK